MLLWHQFVNVPNLKQPRELSSAGPRFTTFRQTNLVYLTFHRRYFYLHRLILCLVLYQFKIHFIMNIASYYHFNQQEAALRLALTFHEVFLGLYC
jgi:hypothetical protein